jgi:hypothetical protein
MNDPWSPLAVYRWGAECARLDVRECSVRRAVGQGVWAGIPHTPMFWKGYQQYLDAPDRAQFLGAVRRLTRLLPGGSDPAAWPKA